jgi:hypothetical protein
VKDATTRWKNEKSSKLSQKVDDRHNVSEYRKQEEMPPSCAILLNVAKSDDKRRQERIRVTLSAARLLVMLIPLAHGNSCL